jgi:hypothetical protein
MEQDGEAPPSPPPPPPPPQLIADRAPGPPQAVQTSTSALSLQWAPVSCTLHSPMAVAVEYNINYELQMQQVRREAQAALLIVPINLPPGPHPTGRTLQQTSSQHHPRPLFLALSLQIDDKTGLQPERWSVQYVGTACFVQVKGLRAGKAYAARVTAVPQVTNLLEVVVLPSPPSDTVLVHTLPCAPMGQPAPLLASRLKKELTAGVGARRGGGGGGGGGGGPPRPEGGALLRCCASKMTPVPVPSPTSACVCLCAVQVGRARGDGRQAAGVCAAGAAFAPC